MRRIFNHLSVRQRNARECRRLDREQRREVQARQAVVVVVANEEEEEVGGKGREGMGTWTGMTFCATSKKKKQKKEGAITIAVTLKVAEVVALTTAVIKRKRRRRIGMGEVESEEYTVGNLRKRERVQGRGITVAGRWRERSKDVLASRPLPTRISNIMGVVIQGTCPINGVT